MKRSGPLKRDGRLRRLGHLVNELLADGNLAERGIAGLCAELWPQIVGPWYAQHTRTTGLRGKDLSVWCDSAALAQQLQYDQETIIGRLNERLGGSYIESLRPASVGPESRRNELLRPPAAPVSATERELAGITLTADELAFLEHAAGPIADPELRASYVRSLDRELRLRRWKLARGWRPCQVCGELTNELSVICFPCRVAQQEPPRQGSDEDVGWKPK